MGNKNHSFSCPSAQPDMENAQVFGVVSGTPTEPRIAYLRTDAIIKQSTLENIGALEATHVFRFSAKCEENRCSQFDGTSCGLGRRIANGLDPVVDVLPSCQIRPTCRWYAENGKDACFRCPQVVTLIPHDKSKLSQVAQIPLGMANAKTPP
jgi:hypothetical protein